MSTASEKTIARIKKVLAKAKGTDSEHEAQVFYAHAAELMTRHQIEEHELGMDDEGHRAGGAVTTWTYRVTNSDNAGRQRVDLVFQVVTVMGGAMFRRSVKNATRSGIYFMDCVIYAEENTLEIIKELVPLVLLQAENGMTKGSADYRQRLRDMGLDAKTENREFQTWRRSYLMGFGVDAAKKIKTARLGVVDEVMGSGKGEIVLKSESDRAREEMEKLVPNLKKGAKGRGINADGFLEGKKDGSRAMVGQREVNNKRTAISG
ncbi:DUF2786 domain-containing protein [Streptomyces sp. 5.8]|uniref:DUF2786 domain-containing protein n=1 Tax=Streptomyces sp. 5.8 TaxID=3406571 RepID=UPI003BB68E8C